MLVRSVGVWVRAGFAVVGVDEVGEQGGGGGCDVATGDDGGLTGAERRELAQLGRESRRLRDAVEILNRVVAVFAAAAPRPSLAGDENRPDASE
jgi:hypothetical protein